MTWPVGISLVALLFSGVSLAFSIYVALRDRSRLKTSCILLHPHPDLPWPYPSVGIRAVNAGRRTIILRYLACSYGKGRWSRDYIDYEKGGRQLGEHEFYERTLRFEPDDYSIFYYRPEEPETLEELWIEDTLGRRHSVKNSRRVMQQFWAMIREERARAKAAKEAAERERSDPVI